MIDILFDFYKEELSIKNILFSDMKTVYYALHTAPYYLPITAITLTVLIQLNSPIHLFWLVIIFLSSIVIPLVIIMYLYKEKENEKIEELYEEELKKLPDQDSDNLKWNSSQIKNIMKKNLSRNYMH